MGDKLRSILDDYSGRIKSLLGNDLVGIYLTGSIVLGGYHDVKSDIDFAVVIRQPLDDKQISGIKIIHKEILKKYPKNIFEGHYITPDVLGKSKNEIEPVILYDKGKIFKACHGISIVTWSTLKNYGVTTYGMPQKTFH